MKLFIEELLANRQLTERFWAEDHSHLIVTPPTPRKVSIEKRGDTITIREASDVGTWWFSQPLSSYEDIEMQFRVTDSGDWIPLYVKEGSNKPRVAYRIVEESFWAKPIVAKRQLQFAAAWASRLLAKGLLRGLVENLRLHNEDL